MNSIITEQINKFKTGDFSGYESFYNETVNTVYTMLYNIVNDQDTATSLVALVYDKIYANIRGLMDEKEFYRWLAGIVNEIAFSYLESSGSITKTGDDSQYNPADDSAFSNNYFYDYAEEDEALTITEPLLEDDGFQMRMQRILYEMPPMEKIIFQDYYFFGNTIREIEEKTGCPNYRIQSALTKTRTSILEAIDETTSRMSEQHNASRYRFRDVPWLWIVYQNMLGRTLGIEIVSLSGWMMGASAIGGMAAGGAVGAAGAMAGAGIGAESVVAGSMQGAGAAGAMAGTGMAGSAAAGSVAAGGSAGGGLLAGFLGTVGGKIAIGVAGAAIATSIGFGVHHVVTSREPESVKPTVAPNVTEVAETTETTTETEETTVTTTEAMTQETTAAAAVDESNDMGVSKIDYDKVAKEAYKEFLLSGLSTGTLSGLDGDSWDTTESGVNRVEDDLFEIADIDGDGKAELTFKRLAACVAGYWGLAYTYNTDTKTVEVKYNTGPYATYYATGYVRFDISHNQGPSSIWPCTYGKFENGQIVLLYDVSNWDKSLSSDGFPDEQDLDGDGCIYYITDCATGETRTVDKPEYDAFMQGLNLGEEMQLDYKSYTTENVNAIQ